MRYRTDKKPGDPTYSAEWSGVTHSPPSRNKRCPVHETPVHKEGDSWYCPRCDDYVRPIDRKVK